MDLELTTTVQRKVLKQALFNYCSDAVGPD